MPDDDSESKAAARAFDRLALNLVGRSHLRKVSGMLSSTNEVDGRVDFSTTRSSPAGGAKTESNELSMADG